MFLFCVKLRSMDGFYWWKMVWAELYSWYVGGRVVDFAYEGGVSELIYCCGVEEHGAMGGVQVGLLLLRCQITILYLTILGLENGIFAKDERMFCSVQLGSKGSWQAHQHSPQFGRDKV